MSTTRAPATQRVAPFIWAHRTVAAGLAVLWNRRKKTGESASHTTKAPPRRIG